MNFAQEVEADSIAAEREAIEALRTLHGIKEGRKAFEAEEKKARIPIDDWFLGHPDEQSLTDPELGFVAKLQSGGTSLVYEAVHLIAAKDEALFRRLLELGCLSIDADAVKTAQGKGLIVPGDLDHWRKPVERSRRLLVERVK